MRSPREAAASGAGLVINVAEYGSLGTANDSAAFQAAFNAASAGGGAVVVAPYGSYNVTNLHVGSGVKVWLPGVTLVNIGPEGGSRASCLILNSGETSEVLIYGVEIDGSNAYRETDGIVLQGTHNRVTSAYVHDVPRYGAYVKPDTAPATAHIAVDHCRMQRCGNSGIVVGSAANSVTRHTTIFANHVKDCIHAAISITGELAVVANNVTEETTPVSEVAADALTGYSTGDAGLLCIGNSFYTAHNHGVHLGGNRLTVVGNLIYEPAQSGVYIAEHVVNGEALPTNDFIVADNTIVSPGTRDQGQGYGVYAEGASAGVISGNEIVQPRTIGVSMDKCDTVAITGNVVRAPALDSAMELSGCQRIAIAGNTLYDSHGYGVEINDEGTPASTDIAIADNLIDGNPVGGVFVAGGLATRVVVAGNTITGNGGAAVSLSGPENRTAANLTDTSDTVASDPTLDVGRDVAFATVTGGEAIRELSAESAEVGRVLALRFRDGCSLEAGGNLRLAFNGAGYLDAPANSVLVLVCDGSDWYQSAGTVD
ncbi:MAG TPA: right-handed parallel beta-helix repeat-containing protein [Solirubrobacteraceae bacterium]|nr:right-handed parallel beta-helix repeat-containing protein [Solirubrobacteraceae bacterium]